MGDHRRETVDCVFVDIPTTLCERNPGVVKLFNRSIAHPLIILEGDPGGRGTYYVVEYAYGRNKPILSQRRGLETLHTGIIQYQPSVSRALSTTSQKEWIRIVTRFFCGHVHDLNQ